MKITADEVRQTALLGRLALSEDEVKRLTGELDAILGYMEQLAALDTTGVEPTTHAVPVELPFRDDTLGEQFSLETALSDAPRREGAFFEVPKIIEGGQ
jgi:aspartyl-tRNA(Asn)/glutamyl-tRNA(Gln) amidotransferase subunit C